MNLKVLIVFCEFLDGDEMVALRVIEWDESGRCSLPRLNSGLVSHSVDF